MAEQLPLGFRIRSEATLENFLPGDNGLLLNELQRLFVPASEDTLFISGPRGCGKTHLLMAACQSAEKHGLSSTYLPLDELKNLSPDILQNLAELDLVALDNVQAVSGIKEWEHALFSLFNQARERGCKLVFSADRGPASLDMQLADLKSRLTWGAAFQIDPLDDNGKRQLLLKTAERLGLVLKEEAATYLISRCSRDINTLLELLDKLDRASMIAQRKLTLPFVRAQLEKLGCLDQNH